MKQDRQASAAQIVENYITCRPGLTANEQFVFDKAVKLIEEISTMEETPRTLAFDSAFTAGLMAVAAERPALDYMTTAIALLATRVLILNRKEMLKHGGGDSN